MVGLLTYGADGVALVLVVRVDVRLGLGNTQVIGIANSESDAA